MDSFVSIAKVFGWGSQESFTWQLEEVTSLWPVPCTLHKHLACPISSESENHSKSHLLHTSSVHETGMILRTGGRTARYVVWVVAFGILHFWKEVTEVLPWLFLLEHDALDRLQEVEMQEHSQDRPVHSSWTLLDRHLANDNGTIIEFWRCINVCGLAVNM